MDPKHLYILKEKIMRRALLATAVLTLLAVTVRAQTAEEIIGKYIKAVGGMEKIKAVKTLVRAGKFTGGGGFEAVVRLENKRPDKVREEFSLQGMTGINAYDGKSGWKVEPWSGKKDPESLGEEEMKGILEAADFDGHLIDYKEKGHKVKYLGMEPVEGTDAYKLEVTLANGDTWSYFMDTDYYVPIKVSVKRIIRGAEQEFEMAFGDYKEVDGWYLPFSIENYMKGAQERAKTTFEKIEANVALSDERFEKPAAAGK